MSQSYSKFSTPVNVRPHQRVLSVLAGAALMTGSVRGKYGLVKVLAGGMLIYRGLTGYCPVFAALGKKKLPDPVNNLLIRSVVRVKRPRHDVYTFWRKLGNLPLFMHHLSSVREISATRSRWKMNLIGRIGTVKWEAEITREIPDTLIEWDAVPGSPLLNAGRVVFEDAGNNETDIHAIITYTAPMGARGDFIAKLIMNPVLRTIVNEDISNVKYYLESGRRATIV